MKTVFITGANSGIGFEAAKSLAEKGFQVILSGRKLQKGLEAVENIKSSTKNSEVYWLTIDLSEPYSIKEAVQKFYTEFSSLDVLVNNAGLMLDHRTENSLGQEMTMATNHLGHFLLTYQLMPMLKRNTQGLVINTASDAHRRIKGIRFDDFFWSNNYNAWKVYGQSKLANMLFAHELDRRFRSQSVFSVSFHPGVVATEFSRGGDTEGFNKWSMELIRPFLMNASESSKMITYLITHESWSSFKGMYFQNYKPKKPRKSFNIKEAIKLWQLSEKLLDISFRGEQMG